MSMSGGGLSVRRRMGKELIFRLTPRLLRRWRRSGRVSWMISSRTASCNRGLRRGGNGAESYELSAYDANGMQERETIGVDIGFARGLVHQSADSEVGHHEPEEFLAAQIGRLAAQDDFGAAQVGLQFVQGGFDFPTLVVERGQVRRRSLFGIENRGDETVDRLGVGDAFQPVFEDPH